MTDRIYPPNKLFRVTDLGCLVFIGVFLESCFSMSSEDCEGKGMLLTNLRKLLQRPKETYKIPQGRRRDGWVPWSSWESLRTSRICYLEMAEGTPLRWWARHRKGCPSWGTLATALYFQHWVARFDVKMKDTIVERVWEHPCILLHLCEACIFLQEPPQWRVLRSLRPWIIHDGVCRLQRCVYTEDELTLRHSGTNERLSLLSVSLSGDTHTRVHSHVCNTHMELHTQHTHAQMLKEATLVLFIKMCLRRSPGGAKVGIIINGIKRKIRT